jgi:hypothetical protein
MRIVRLVRNVEFGRLFDSFLYIGISTILIVRFYLIVTGLSANRWLYAAYFAPFTRQYFNARSDINNAGGSQQVYARFCRSFSRYWFWAFLGRAGQVHNAD